MTREPDPPAAPEDRSTRREAFLADWEQARELRARVVPRRARLQRLREAALRQTRRR